MHGEREGISRTDGFEGSEVVGAAMVLFPLLRLFHNN